MNGYRIIRFQHAEAGAGYPLTESRLSMVSLMSLTSCQTQVPIMLSDAELAHTSYGKLSDAELACQIVA
jgi:hypothetical protein